MTRNFKLLFLILFILGAGIRAIDTWRPVDGRINPPWREADMASIARNYYLEDMNLFYPRIDWRGNGPGFAEMEFPIFPWSIALLYKIFGFHEVLGRLLSYLLSLITLGVFFRLARYLLPVLGAVAASIFFVFSREIVSISNSLQPEGLMLLCYVLAVYAFIRWLHEDSWGYYALALGATAFAILSKATAAHIGLFLTMLILHEKGLGALRNWRTWFFAVGSLLPAVLWYAHAHKFWLVYGNSLGVSNEYHWIGLDFFTNLLFIRGLLSLEILYVWMPTGFVVAAFGLLYRRSQNVVRYGGYWLAAILVFYLIAVRSTSEGWALYYHVVSVPVVSLLFGNGVEAFKDLVWRRWSVEIVLIASVFAASSLVIAAVLMGNLGWEGLYPPWLHNPMKGLVLVGFLATLLFGIHAIFGLKGLSFRRSLSGKVLFGSLFFFIFATFLSEGILLAGLIHPRTYVGAYQCAAQFKPHIPEKVLIVASGGNCHDEQGYVLAINASYMFYWLERKGFNICVQEQSIERLKSLSRRGAKYFIAEKWALKAKEGFGSTLLQHFTLVTECPGALLFKL